MLRMQSELNTYFSAFTINKLQSLLLWKSHTLPLWKNAW